MTKEEEIKQLKQRIDFYKRELFYSARQVISEERKNTLLKGWLKKKLKDIAGLEKEVERKDKDNRALGGTVLCLTNKITLKNKDIDALQKKAKDTNDVMVTATAKCTVPWGDRNWSCPHGHVKVGKVTGKHTHCTIGDDPPRKIAGVTGKKKDNEPVFAKTRKEDGTYWFTAWEPNPNDGVLFSQLWCKDNGKFYLVEEFELSHDELQKKIVGVTGKKKDDVQEVQTRRPMMDANDSIMREYIE